MVKKEAGTNFTPVGGLVTAGPFAYTRNPLYLAATGMLVGVAFLLDSVWHLLTSLIFLLYVHFLVIPAEEAFLGRLFPGAYTDFCKAAPRWLGPV
jgi:protein-S-isoprenylcysteine O-methyltransferase Ste14